MDAQNNEMADIKALLLKNAKPENQAHHVSQDELLKALMDMRKDMQSLGSPSKTGGSSNEEDIELFKYQRQYDKAKSEGNWTKRVSVFCFAVLM